MTPKYWFRIIFGMLAIFTVGMLFRAGFRKGRGAIHEIADGSGTINIPLLGLPFKLESAKLGSLQRLSIERSSPKTVTGFHLYATLSDTVALAKFDDCRLTVTNPNNINEHTSFRCASVEDSTSQEMVPFGTVTLQPSGRDVVLLVPESVKRDLQHNRDGEANGNGSDSVDMNLDSSNGSMNLKVNGKDIFSMKGDSTGGHIVVHDGKGKEVVNLKMTAPPKPPAVKKP
ncbi:MAG: hypothetical protein ABIZ70_04985 [Gemmatimonadales bacterium]